MKVITRVLLVLLLSGVANAAKSYATILERKAYRCPSYEEAVKSTDVERYADKAAYEKAINDLDFEFEKMTYLSDGLKVVAYVYRPKQMANKKFPTIIFNRGSAVRNDIAPELVTFFNRLARAGFVVVAPMLRQSDGGEGRDEMGGADIDDITNLLPVMSELGFIDTTNLFMYGESRGGMMTYLAIRKRFPINAAAVFGALTDLQQLADSHPKQYSPTFFKQLWPDFETRKEDLFAARSAIRWADELKVPLLIMHGGADKGVDPDQSLSLAQKLQKQGTTYELIIYAGDGHVLRNNQLDRDQRAVAWFRRFLKGSN